MKVKYKEKIGDHTIVRFVTDATVDTEATKEKIAPMVNPEMAEEDVHRIYMDNLVYAKVGTEADLIEDSAAEEIQQRLDAMGEKQLLLDNGGYIADNRGIEYWVNNSGEWVKEQVEGIGIALPSSAVLQENLSKGQQDEIAAQQEAERIAAMSVGDKVKARQAALDALADEADRLDRRARIQNSVFDPVIWYNDHAGAVEAKYA